MVRMSFGQEGEEIKGFVGKNYRRTSRKPKCDENKKKNHPPTII